MSGVAASIPMSDRLREQAEAAQAEHVERENAERAEVLERLEAQILNWSEIEAGDFGTDWLVDDFWPSGGMIHLHAKAGVGKSMLLLFVAADLAIGNEPFRSGEREPVVVLYVDYEMTKADLKSRLEAGGYDFDKLKNLHYLQQPDMAYLDTEEGGTLLVGLVERIGAKVVIIDTMSACVEGEENSADTYKAFDHYTSTPLKGMGVAVARLDHEGHNEKRSRGSSAKATAPDLIWGLTKSDDGLTLDRKKCRVDSDVDKIALTQDPDPLRFQRTGWSYPAGTKAKAEELDKAKVPLDASKTMARNMLKEAGFTPGRDAVVLAALKARREPSPDRPPVFTKDF